MAEPLKLPERELQSSSEEYRELPVDVDGLEDSGTLPRRKGLSKVVEEPDADTRVVLNGLQLRVKGHKQAFISFSYALTPFMESRVKVDWKILTAEGVECQHIQFHQLQKGEDLSSLVLKYKKSHAVAIILVNIDDSYNLASQFTEEFIKTKKGNFPVVLVTGENGQSLKEFLNHHDPGELSARIMAKNMPQVELPSQQLASGSYSPTLPSKSLPRQGIRRSFRYRSSRKFSINLKEEIKLLMFPLSGPMCVSEDAGLFQVVMSTFYQHEQMAQKEGHPGDGGVFRKLIKYLDEMFARDFPFYLLVAYRVHRKQQLYQCDELSPFVHNCIEKFEKLEQVSIAKTLETFLRMENFKIMFDPSNAHSTVFQLLEEACIELMKISFTMKSHETSRLPHRYAYYRMLWITVASKCRVERGAREHVDYWREYFTSYKLHYLNTENIHDVKRGVEFGRLLQLPDEMIFTSDHMAEILISAGSVRPFNHIREFVLILEPYVQVEEDFVRNFMRKPRVSYEQCFYARDEDRLRAVNPEGNLLVIIQEGLGFLDTVLDICRKRHWTSSSMDEEMKRWLTLLLQLVDVTSDHAESYLKDFLTTKSGGITKQYKEHIKREVICKMEENFSKLSVEQFLQLYKAFLIWPTWVVEHYLRQYKIPQSVKICSPTWNEFFAEFVERFTDAHHHQFLLEFLKSVATCYLEQQRAKDFLLDLLQLDVPNLFVMDSEGSTCTLSTGHSDILATSVPDEFTNFLSDYIRRNSLKEAILSEVKTIWESIAEHSDFQQLILLVLQQELLPESLAVSGTLSEPMKYILEKCVTVICRGIGSLNDLSSRLSFCWGVVASCCEKMPISDNFDWINSYLPVVSQLSRIYGTYCNSKGIEEDQCILKKENLPADITECSFHDVKKFFSWVCKAQQMLSSWQRKFTTRHVNYDEILLYAKYCSQVNRVASVFSAEGVVVDMQDVNAVKQDFLQSFELLNMFLLHYIPSHPDSGWCALQHMLSKYGVGLPSQLLRPITVHVTFPGEKKSVAKQSLALDHRLPANVSKNFLPGLDISLEITRELDLHELKLLVQGLDGFLTPIQSELSMLVFFYLSDSEIFDKYLKLQLRKMEAAEASPSKQLSTSAFALPAMVLGRKEEFQIPQGISVQTLAEALTQTRELLLKLIQGTALYTDIIADGSLDLKLLDIDQEFEVLNSYAKFAKINIVNAEGLRGVKAMLQLFQFTRHIQTIHYVCQQYQLENCLADPELQELVRLVDMLKVEENRAKLTARDAIEKMERVSRSLCLQGRQNPRYLELFAAVADSAFFHQFVTEKQFVGESGQALFRQQYQLITTQLQHEEYNEAVLNHLFAAFKFITPFTDKAQKFNSLITQVASLNASDARRELETVNRNINLIRLWFSRAEGDTLQGVANELECVVNTGCYHFVFNSTVVGIAATVELRYRPLAWSPPDVRDIGALDNEVVEQKWSDEQINDFVRKLGFLDAEGTVGDQINHFLHLNQTAKKLLDLYSKLRELGHPEYLEEALNQVLPCSFTPEEADQKVMEAAETLSEWEKEVTQLRSQYEQLLFFTIPKLLHLYHMITAPELNLDGITQEVSFLFQNQPDVRQKLKDAVKDILKSKKRKFRHRRDLQNTPMHVVGSFVADLFKNSELSSHSLRRRRPSLSISRSLSSQSTHILHSCQTFSQCQLLRLIISIYGGVPEAFEVFHCRPTTTEEELCLFLNPKRATKRPFQYLILEVNRLPYQLQEALLHLHFELKEQHSEAMEVPCVHFIETAPTLLQEMPWILHRDYKGTEPPLDFAQAMMTCKKSALNPDDFSCIQLVYGHAGDGKTHYIESQLKHCPQYLKIAVNEAFTPLSAIRSLSSLPSDVVSCAVFFNFTLLPPGESVDEVERKSYEQLIETIGWFFFDLLILGYVEDPLTGNSFRFPGGMSWALYFEVPSRNGMSPEESLGEFYEDMPALGMLGTPHLVYPETPYVVDEDVQLVCKYLRAYRTGGTKGIDRLYREVSGFPSLKSRPGLPVKFSLDPNLSENECRRLLDHFIPPHMRRSKATQKLFVKYMKRRCAFLDNCPAFNYNSGASEYVKLESGQMKRNDTTHLGSTLMDTMLKEVSDFCDPIIRENWSLKPHHQLIYDFKDGGGSFGLMSLHPEQIPEEEKEKYKKIGVEIPSMLDLHSRKKLDSYLSRALDLDLDDNGRLSPVDDSAYVLTLDFAIKMLNIHERAECGVPVIIEGETGVGKTALIEMLSKLWNCSLVKKWNIERERLLDYIKRRLGELPPKSLEGYHGCVEAIASLSAGEPIREDELILIGELPDEKAKSGQFYSVLRDELLKLIDDPILSLIELSDDDRQARMKFSTLFAAAKYKNNPKDTARLLHAFLNAKVKNTFHKLNVHAAVQPSDIKTFFESIFKQARDLSEAYDDVRMSRKPFVAVFLDEVNTSSCLGLLKEVIVDRTLDGQPIPHNIFIVGACNPHRGNSLAALSETQDTWVRGSYYVRQLHPTLHCLMWDYGALGERQERDYILAKMTMCNKFLSNADLANLSDLIGKSQNLMRSYALDQLKTCGLSEGEASACSRSCVSQRDIQRVFTFYEWLMKMYGAFKPYGKNHDYSARAVVVALGLVYYLRLDSKHRKMYEEELDHQTTLTRISFSKTFDEELNWYIKHVDLPEGIAKTRALKENLLATIVCTMTHTPLIIVGCPGSSKTLSFNLTLANLKGEESKREVFRNTKVFRSLDPHFYQCSRRTTSNEIQIVFSRAINRQRSHAKVPLPVYCVVFMDEAGLPEEQHESLKILHYYLDTQEISFVAISNHVLDAAKTNRAVSLYRPEASKEDLNTLAKGCLCATPDNPPPELRKDVEIVTRFCRAFETIMNMEEFQCFFGLRDFIHFISYLRRKRMEMISPQLVMKALERNFNGVKSKQFRTICDIFLKVIHSSIDKVESRNILDILRSSLSDHPKDTGAENEMRYKLIIDASEDGFLVKFLFSSGVLQRGNTREFVCSDFPGDAQLQKVNTIAAIRHSATEGHTIVMSQTDAVHESFYDLFNRRFHRIDANTGPRYYANVAIGAHIKPCRVHPDFECVVVLKKSELDHIPPPFLNRFEKYLLSHRRILAAALSQLPPCLTKVLKTAQEKAEEFLAHIGDSVSIYSLQKDTVNSLLLTLLPPAGFGYQNHYKPPSSIGSIDMKVYVMETLLQTLRENCGFHIPACSPEELRLDAEEIFNHVLRDSEFAGHISLLNVEVTLLAITDALYALYHSATSAKREVTAEISVDACMIVSVLTQWLTRHLCKQLFQLMTPEALCMRHRKIPSSYIQNYLNHQHHFSLKTLVEAQVSLLNNSRKAPVATKLVCFTRSSQLLHQMPAQYPTAVHPSTHNIGDAETLLSNLVFANLEQLVIQKLSSITSFTSMNELLKTFVASKSKRVLLLMVNMQETSREVVTHLRIMIEEVENQSSTARKLFILLLHFPAARPTTPCYSSLFLQGWDFHYLDVIGCGPKGGILNIRDWFKQCYAHNVHVDGNSVALQLNELLREAIHVVSSRVIFGSCKSSSFNKPMSLPERNSTLEELFFEKGVGEIFCEQFRSYWQPNIMVEYLEKAAAFAQQHETSLNLIDSLQELFKSLFFDFVVHMVSKINSGMNIDVVFSDDCTPAVHGLFLDLLRTHPIPRLSDLKMLRIVSDTCVLDGGEEAILSPKFPFFKLISNEIEKLVDQSRREINQQVDITGEQSEPHLSLFQGSLQSKSQTMTDMLHFVQTKLENLSKKDEKSMLAVAVNALLRNDGLWQKYLEDFTRQKLHLDSSNSGISHKILQAAFGKLEERDALQRVAILHIYVHVHKLNLARVASVLRPLDKIEVAASILPSLVEKVRSPSQSFLHDVQHSGGFLGSPEALSVFIMDTLFSAIAGINMSHMSEETTPATATDSQETEGSLKQLTLWYKVYRDVMSMPTLREHIYKSRSEIAEAQHNLMHTLFLVLRSQPIPNSFEIGLKVFSHLFERFFRSAQEQQRKIPRLGNVAVVAVELLTGTKVTVALARDNPLLGHIMEGLLGHFFSEYHSSYHPQDIQWFLQIANLQSHWQSTFLMSEVIEVEYSGDLLALPNSPTEDKYRKAGCLPMSVFKFYLHRILLQSTKVAEEPLSSVMLSFQNHKATAHSLVAEALCSSGDPSTPAPYIPTFYQFCGPVKQIPAADNQLMQQPLAHLYFLTVFESLVNSQFNIGGLIKTVQQISKQCGTLPDSEAVLLQIEKQAVVQAFIRELAQHLDLRKDSKINVLGSLLDDVNAVLDDESMGGGSIGGHGLVLAMHMLKELKSFHRFTLILTEQYCLLCDGINCLKPFHTALTNHTPLKHEQSFMPYVDMGPEFQALYQRVYTVFSAIHTTHGNSSRVKELTRLADECTRGEFTITTPSGGSSLVSKSGCFKMALWLCTYNEFFSKKKSSQILSRTVGMHLTNHLEAPCIQLLRCFLDPELMNRRGNDSGSHPRDPIYNIFSPPTLGPEDPSDIDLRTALVHLIAIVLGCTPQSNHLWYHMFAPEELVNTYITGFMHNIKVGPESQMFYDLGVELTEDGLYGQHDYLQHATRGTLSLHSLYLLLWANFAAFCVAILIQPDTDQKLLGRILSDTLSVRQYSFSQLQKMWSHIQSGLSISEDERSLFVRACLNQLFEVQLKSAVDTRGKLLTSHELDRYEELWHSEIFIPCWNSLKDEFTASSPIIQNNVFQDIRIMDGRYPWFPTERTLTQSILSQANISDPSLNKLYPLSRFVIEYPRLRKGGDLLPGMVELYQWLHTELTYAVTYEEATTITLKRLAKVVDKHTPGDQIARFEKLKAAFNDYVHLTGCTRSKRPATIGDDTPLLHLLSYFVDGEQGNDLLYCVIADVINFHNEFLETLLESAGSSMVYASYLSEEVPCVHVMEFTQYSCFVGRSKRQGHSDMLQLIRSRSHVPLAFPTDIRGHPIWSSSRSNLPGQMAALIDLDKLQEDMLSCYIAGKPVIDASSIECIRVPFKFKEDPSTSSLHLNLRDTAVDLNGISQKLPEQFKIPLEDTYRRRLEYEFHSAGYHAIMEVVTGLRTVTGHLIREVTTEDMTASNTLDQLASQTLPDFLISLYEYDPQDDSSDVFQEIGIHSLSQTQHHCLEALGVVFLYHALKLFVHWAEDGWYDFSSLPFATKMPMCLPDEDTIMQIRSQYNGSPGELLKELKSLVEVLLHLEPSIARTVTQSPHQPVTNYLRALQICSEEKLTSMIPETVRLEHYVALRLCLRRLIVEVQKHVTHQDLQTPEPSEEKWDDFISDLWDTRLPHFRQRGYVYSSIPSSEMEGTVPQGREHKSSEILNELIHYSSETNLLEAVEHEETLSVTESGIPVESSVEISIQQSNDDEAAALFTRSTRSRVSLKSLTSPHVEDVQQMASRYTCQDVVTFLESIQLGQYAIVFEEYEINGELLIEFGDDELKEMGVFSPLHRLKIRVCFQRLVLGSQEIVDRYPPSAVAHLLEENTQLKKFAASFIENGIDGELLLNASDEVLRELGVEKGVYMHMIRNKLKSLLL